MQAAIAMRRQRPPWNRARRRLIASDEGRTTGNVRPSRLLVIYPWGRTVPRADVFVAMPFTSVFSEVYRRALVPVVASLGHSIARGDDAFTANEVMRDVWWSICQSKAVVADCTDKNPNVFYEIGLAHTIGKPVVLITQREADIPFDLRQIRYVAYDSSLDGIERLADSLRATLAPLLAEV